MRLQSTCPTRSQKEKEKDVNNLKILPLAFNWEHI
jgi:hypothetical protein